MANKKKLQQAAIKFRKENPKYYDMYSAILSQMARYIIKKGISEVGYKNGELYVATNH